MSQKNYNSIFGNIDYSKYLPNSSNIYTSQVSTTSVAKPYVHPQEEIDRGKQNKLDYEEQLRKEYIASHGQIKADNRNDWQKRKSQAQTNARIVAAGGEDNLVRHERNQKEATRLENEYIKPLAATAATVGLSTVNPVAGAALYGLMETPDIYRIGKQGIQNDNDAINAALIAAGIIPSFRNTGAVLNKGLKKIGRNVLGINNPHGNILQQYRELEKRKDNLFKKITQVDSKRFYDQTFADKAFPKMDADYFADLYPQRQKNIKERMRPMHDEYLNRAKDSMDSMYSNLNNILLNTNFKVDGKRLRNIGENISPEYIKFLSENITLDPFAQSTLDAFFQRQGSSVRGVYVPKGEHSDQLAQKYLTTPPKKGETKGGDRLGGGGLYSSNSYGIADKFMRATRDEEYYDSYIGHLRYDFGIDKSQPLEDQLKQYRRKINNTKLDIPNTSMREAEYVRNGGDIYNHVYERSILPTSPDAQVVNIVKMQKVGEGMKNLHGRWGYGDVKSDNDLFIPKQYNKSFEDYLRIMRARRKDAIKQEFAFEIEDENIKQKRAFENLIDRRHRQLDDLHYKLSKNKRRNEDYVTYGALGGIAVPIISTFGVKAAESFKESREERRKKYEENKKKQNNK